MNISRKTFSVALSGAVVVAAACILYILTGIYSHPLLQTGSKVIYIDRDDTVDSVYHALQMDNTRGFDMLSRMRGYRVRTGAYRLQGNESSLEIYRKLSRGHQTPVKLVVSEQRTVDRVIGLMARQLMIDSVEISQVLLDSSRYARLGISSATLPAFFIPNTYEVYWNMDASKLYTRLEKEYQRFWNTARRTRAEEIGLTPVEVSTLASIVDEETANSNEKPIVAGLYMNRLKRGIPLQADPTVKFAVGDVSLQRILFKHLETDSPYNTYKHLGLPPGPIRIPSVRAIESVLNYTRHNYLYMCAKEDLSGTHNFACTLSQHNANARRYQQELNRRKIR